jgi:hypothetical protein
MSPLVYDIMLGRLREPPGRLWLATTPRGRGWVHRLFADCGSDHYRVRAPTWTNTFLPSTFLPSLRERYGDSSFARQEIEGEEIDDDTDVLIPSSWLDAAFSTRPGAEGPTRIGVDLGGGSGGDRTVLVARDDANVLEIRQSRAWGLEAAAKQVAMMQARWHVVGERIAFDRPGLGTDFAHRLDEAGVRGAKAYVGGASGGHRFSNLRTAAAWGLRQRMDPGGRGVLRADADDGSLYRTKGLGFAIPRDYSELLRPELAAIRWRISNDDRKIALEPKEDLAADLGHSPDIADALIISFAYPYA